MELKTVGDAAAEYANKKYATDKGYPEEDWYISWLSFREGAKWQEEKMYNEEEVRQAQQAILGNIKDALMNKDYSIEYLNQNKIIMSNDRHIWEGWTVNDFINELEITFPYQKFNTKQEVKDWCKSEQPYYKKHIPEVTKHFIQKAKL